MSSKNNIIYHLSGQVLLHVLLNTPQDERLQHLVQFGVAPLFSPTRPVLLIELLPAGKLQRHQEVEQGPQLLQRVLQRRPGDENLVVRIEGEEGLIEEGLLVLEPVGLVNHEDGPGQGAQLRLVLGPGLAIKNPPKKTQKQP